MTLADEPRYRPAILQNAEGCWTAAVVLFEDDYCERYQHDSEVVASCPHWHRSEQAAIRCTPQMRRIADKYNESL